MVITNDIFIKYSDTVNPIEGKGSLENPYQIAHPNHFEFVRENLSSHFKLILNLDLEENKNFKPIGSQKNPFEGTFDGGGKIIRNLKIQRPNEYGVGLFGYAQEGSVIRNVRLENIDIQGKQCVGGLLGVNVHREITEAFFDAKEKSDEVKAWKEYGDIFKKRNRYGGKVRASYAVGKVDGKEGIGGLVGWNDGTIEASYATGEVNGNDIVFGGLVGWNDGTIKTSYATGKVGGKDYVGGLVGGNVGTIESSYATGKVNGKKYVGILVGGNVGTIKTSYATGEVNGNDEIGGLVGSNGFMGKIESSYATGEVNGKENVGGFVGHNDEEGRIEGKNYWGKGSIKEGIGKNDGKVSHIEGKSDSEMILKELEWNLEVWILDHKKHPLLRWQSSQ